MPDAEYTRKHAFLELGGTESEWNETPEPRSEGGPLYVPPRIEQNAEQDESKQDEDSDDDYEASFEMPKLDNIAWFGVYEPEIDDDGHYDFQGCNIYSRPSKYEPLVRMHLLMSALLTEYRLFKRQQEDTSRKYSSDFDDDAVGSNP